MGILALYFTQPCPFGLLCARTVLLTLSAHVLCVNTECPECKLAPPALISLLGFPKEWVWQTSLL